MMTLPAGRAALLQLGHAGLPWSLQALELVLGAGWLAFMLDHNSSCEDLR